jgi:PIN domain nuclease of toxin-antitoxin system
VIVLDTHIWIWWVNNSPELPADARACISAHESDGLALSAISVWEVAKLVERNRLVLSLPVEQWISIALTYPGIQLIPLSPEIAIESTKLPQPFHRDPADQLIVATSRVLGIPLLTMDSAIQSYPHVDLALARSRLEC